MMFLKKVSLAVLVFTVLSSVALAHKPLLSVEDNEDGTIYVEAGFSDGSSGAGHQIIIKDRNGKVILKKKIPSESSMDIPMPRVPYTVTFYAGEGHSAVKEGPFSKPKVEEKVISAVKVADKAANDAKPAGISVSKIQPAPAGSVPCASPPVIVAPATSQGPGAEMALKMMMISNIAIAVLLAFILALLAFWIGYTVGKSKK